MPNITFTLNSTAMARLQEAVDYYNLSTGQVLSAKAWAIAVLRQSIAATKVGEFRKTQATNEQSFKETLETELDIG